VCPTDLFKGKSDRRASFSQRFVANFGDADGTRASLIEPRIAVHSPPLRAKARVPLDDSRRLLEANIETPKH
jgi:hypothetical protein